ncbi:hypothetical protein CC_0564 [Caulobacter vibrioides CB15]|uniref:Uncharacterized protein n=1 Tax=Caulobacter vibrioides (strain ATCC 19089 / CIP 103742 / CB 15) TaxID=190650 RepID=Q9AAN3_CAUVC|nr:hypothetical protein CC_0564 [Caulobacter vibrioides CB15]
MRPAGSSRPPFGQGEGFVGRAAGGEVFGVHGPAAEQTAFDDAGDSGEGRPRGLRQGGQQGDFPRGVGHPQSLGAMLLDVLDAAQQKQVGRLQEASVCGQLIGGQEQVAGRCGVRSPGGVGRELRPLRPSGRRLRPDDLPNDREDDQQGQRRKADPEHDLEHRRGGLQDLAHPGQPTGDLGRREHSMLELKTALARQTLMRRRDRAIGRLPRNPHAPVNRLDSRSRPHAPRNRDIIRSTLGRDKPLCARANGRRAPDRAALGGGASWRGQAGER